MDLNDIRPAPPPPDWWQDGPGNFPWDKWERKALAAGVDKDLAALGRSVYREADMHDWAGYLKRECGWADEGQAMIELALSNPQQAEERWRHLYATDGEYVEPENTN
jgi:hypothetical protein